MTPSFSTANYPLVAAGRGAVRLRPARSPRWRRSPPPTTPISSALVVEGRTPIDVLIVQAGHGDDVEPTCAATRSASRARSRPASRRCSPAPASSRASDYQTVLLDGFDPVAHIALDGIVGFPGYRSNEPGTLEPGRHRRSRCSTPIDVRRARVVRGASTPPVRSSRTTRRAVEDFVRATMRGLDDAIADPDAAAQTALDLIDGQRQPQLPVAGGRGVPLADRHGDLDRRDADGDAPLGVPDADPAAGRGRRLRRRRPVRRDAGRTDAADPTSPPLIDTDAGDRPDGAYGGRPTSRLARLEPLARACQPMSVGRTRRRSSDWSCPVFTAPGRRSPTSRASTGCGAGGRRRRAVPPRHRRGAAAGSSPCRCSSPCPAC